MADRRVLTRVPGFPRPSRVHAPHTPAAGCPGGKATPRMGVPPQCGPSTRSRLGNRLIGLIVATTLLRLFWAASLGPGNDEAYYAQYAGHLDWSYLDHPPMTAVVAALGMAIGGGGPSPFGLRLGFIALFAGSTWLMARIGSRAFGPGASFFAAAVFNLAGYFGAAVGAFALPDGPLVFFWLLALDRLAVALEARGRTLPWIAVGLAWGGAILSKYHGLLLPATAGLYLIWEPRARPFLRRPGPYLATAIAAVAFAPVVAWNRAHDWASFAFQGGRTLSVSGFRPDCLALGVLGQFAYALPWVWIALMASAWRAVRGRGGTGTHDRFFLISAAVPLSAFLVVAARGPVLPHWGLVGLLPLFPLLGRDWAARDRRRADRRLALFAAAMLSIIGVVAFQAEGGGVLDRLPTGADPTLDSHGWDLLAAELRRRGALEDPHTFIFTGKWFHSGQLAFALGGRAPVLCYSARNPLGFADWSHPEEWVGRDGILVVVGPSSTEPAAFDRWFERIEPLADFEIERAGAAVKSVRAYRCRRQIQPFPFAATGHGSGPSGVLTR